MLSQIDVVVYPDLDEFLLEQVCNSVLSTCILKEAELDLDTDFDIPVPVALHSNFKTVPRCGQCIHFTFFYTDLLGYTALHVARLIILAFRIFVIAIDRSPHEARIIVQ